MAPLTLAAAAAASALVGSRPVEGFTKLDEELPEGFVVRHGSAIDAVNDILKRRRFMAPPGGAPVMPIGDLEDEQWQAFWDLGGAKWRFNWTWVPTIYLWDVGDDSKLSGVYMLQELNADRALWRRAGGGTLSVIYYDRTIVEGDGVLWYDWEEEAGGSPERYWVELKATDGVADASVAEAEMPLAAASSPPPTGGVGDAWSAGEGGAARPAANESVAGGAGGTDAGPAANKSVVGGAGWAARAPSFPGGVKVRRAGAKDDEIEAELELQQGLYWEGMPMYRSEGEDGDAAGVKWMISSDGRWHYAEAPAGLSYEDLLSAGFFWTEGLYAERWKYVSTPHDGNSPLGHGVDWYLSPPRELDW